MLKKQSERVCRFCGFHSMTAPREVFCIEGTAGLGFMCFFLSERRTRVLRIRGLDAFFVK